MSRNASRLAVLSLAAVWYGFLPGQVAVAAPADGRLRVIIETDAGGDPDDEQSLVRFLLYSNEWDVEGIIANRAHTRRPENKNPEATGLGIVRRLVNAYGQCYPNLSKHDARYPKPELLLARTVAGYDETDDAVKLIIAAVDRDDPRPIWYADWGTDKGGADNNLKRTLDRMLAERGPKGYAAFKKKLRVICHGNIFGDHTTKIEPPFRLLVDTFRPPVDGLRWYHRFSALTATAGGFDLKRDVLTGHGPLGALYPTNTTHAQKEGDSMTFLYLVPNGLGDPERPEWGSWAGRYGPNPEFNGRPCFWANQMDAWQGTTHRDNTLKRWAGHLQNDFRARLSWCVRRVKEANHPPSVVVNGIEGQDVIRLSPSAGDVVKLDASDSSDADGDRLTYEWFVYPEAGTYSRTVAIEDTASAAVALRVPADAVGKEIHVIGAVTDSGAPPLTRYRRVIVTPRRRMAELRGEVIDADSGRRVAARVYIHGEDGTWHHARSTDPTGAAVPYSKQRPEANSFEIHTTLSAHPFVADLPPAKYTITVERGKEYHPLTQQVTVGMNDGILQFKLKRWVDLAARGWYSGETHVHRSLAELPTLMQAEELNVTFPLLYWIREAFTPPGRDPAGREADPGRPIVLDRTHVIYPRNTEYEIFTVGKQRHTLGAFFILNHQTVFQDGVPPVGPIARKARREGALIELDKHNWPWSMALVPVMPVDLYELTNNHVWRTEFAFKDFGEQSAEYMNVERTAAGWTEWGWISFGLQNYYALLNCGFRLRPTGGTASGVHPVPLGFGRVYVYLPDGFGADAWIKGLNEGRSFVTTGPMLFVRVNGQAPGHVFKTTVAGEYRVTGSALSERPLHRIEIVVNGEVVRTISPQNRRSSDDAFESAINERVRIDESSWLAVRCFEDRPDRRVRFAHTSPFHVEVAGKPIRPRKAEVEYLISRVEKQIQRSRDLLPPAAVAEYRDALRIYENLAKTAR